MANSFTVGGLELIGTATNPEYRLAKGMDGGAITPDSVTLSSLTLDGEVISGRRTTNKAWSFTVAVNGFVNGMPDRPTLSRNVDRLLAAVTSDSLDNVAVVWTPSGCAATNFTAYRATATPQKNMVMADQGYIEVLIEFATGPFGESVGTQTVTVTASSPPPQLQVDGMNASTFTNATLDTTVKYEGAGSAKITLNRSVATVVGGVTYYRYDTPSTAPGRAISATDLSSYASMSVRFRWPAPANFSGFFANVTLTLLLTSTSGSSYVTENLTVAKGSTAQNLVQFNLAALTAASGAGVNLTAVTSWAIGVAAGSVTDTGLPSTSNAWYDDLRAYPPGSVGNTTAEGSVLTVPALKGSARTPVTVAVTRAAGLGNVLLHSPPATQSPDVTILAGLSFGSVTIPAANMNYNDTFSLVTLLTASAGVGVSRLITATITQKIGATTVGTQTLTLTVVGSQSIIAFSDYLTLPLVAQPAENQSGSLIIALSSASGSDTFSDVALCSTGGQTLIATGLTSAIALYVDKPAPKVGIGQVYASASDRTAAFSAMGQLTAYQGPLQFEPGDNRLLAASTSGAPDIAVTYTPRWLDEAQS